MAETILYGVAVEVLKKLGSTSLNEIASAWHFKAHFEKLNNTINSLKDVLLDAEQKQAHSHAVYGWLERLTAAVYAADDLFDELATLVSRKQHLGSNKMSTEVRAFFSSSNQIALAVKFAHNIKKIRQELDDIVKDGTQFSFVLRPHEEGRVINTSRKRDETYSFVDADEVIGRDGDKKAILDLLLPSSCADHVHGHEVLPVIPIVGMGGMGKTTLAQLIYNDPQVQDCFELSLWVCVSDAFDIKPIIEKILMSTTKSETPKLDMDSLQGLLRKEIGDKKFLLVLDDVWNENREDWLKLKALLKIGRLGSKILVTTRSRKVGKVMGTVPFYELQGLSKEKSWDLFEKVAFEPGQAQQKPHLVKIGEEILKKCGNVPLAIRALGSLLYSEDDSKWLSFKDTSLANISENHSDIMNILKLSYHHLWSPLKKCFAYCALFPKDHWFDKEMLIDLWMAEGFIIPNPKEHQSLEKVAEQYFLTLLQRGFFQDINMNEWGDIKSCKMHDFMHDLAQEVAGVKCKVAEIDEQVFDEKILHLSFAYPLTASWEIPNSMLSIKRLRTFLLLEQMEDAVPLGGLICQQLLTSERSAKLSDLQNLKNLRGQLKIDIHRNFKNMSEAAEANLSDKQGFTALNISFVKGGRFEDEAACEHDEVVLEGLKPHSNIRILHIDDYNGRKLPSWARMDNLCITLPNLVRITLWNCESCQQLPSFSQLRYLKCLVISRVNIVRYMESSVNDIPSSKGQGLKTLFFPSLEALELIGMTNLKGWWKEGESIECNNSLEGTGTGTSSEFAEAFVPKSMQFSKLSKLKIVKCPNLRMLPLCPIVEDLTLRNANKRMSVIGMASSSSETGLKLKRLTIDDAEDLISLPNHCLQQLSHLTIIDDKKLESSEKLGQVFATLSSSLRSLEFHNCDKLRSISKGLQHLTVLENLRFRMCEELDFEGNAGEEDMPWKAFDTSLRSLELCDLDKLVGLPSGFQYLANLRTLELSYNDELKELPEWISCFTSLEYLELWNCPKLNCLPEGFANLTSLNQLRIKGCPGLTERCRHPNGSDWTKIQHIPLLSVLD
ncbi:Disease resistance protein RGA2 [Bienertia sinuspersici]